MTPALLSLVSQDAYLAYYARKYCCAPVVAHDGVEVAFRRKRFYHCCFNSAYRSEVKTTFAHDRAERLDWIEAVLCDSTLPMRVGWNREEKRLDDRRRVSVLAPDYAVVIRFSNAARTEAEFVTHYVGDPETIAKILGNPAWA